MVSIHRKNPEYGIISPLHLNGAGDTLDRGFLSILVRNDCRLVPDGIIGRRLDLYPIPFVNAAAWLISRECLMKVGGFDPLFFHYGEDDNFCQRVIYHGFRIGVCPLGFVRHDREDRDGTFSALFLKDSIARSGFLELTNVNAEPSKRKKTLLRVMHRYCRGMFKAGMKLNICSSIKFLRAIYTLGARWGTLSRHYRINRTGGLNWLQ